MSLPFGSFCTQIPLMIMALLYLMYFGVTVLGKSREKTPEELPPAVIAFQSIETAKPATIDYFSLLQETSQAVIADDPSSISVMQPFIETRFWITRDKIIHNYFRRFEFSRPPPEICLS